MSMVLYGPLVLNDNKYSSILFSAKTLYKFGVSVKDVRFVIENDIHGIHQLFRLAMREGGQAKTTCYNIIKNAKPKAYVRVYRCSRANSLENVVRLRKLKQSIYNYNRELVPNHIQTTVEHRTAGHEVCFRVQYRMKYWRKWALVDVYDISRSTKLDYQTAVYWSDLLLFDPDRYFKEVEIFRRVQGL